MQSENVKLSLEAVLDLLNQGLTVYEIAARTGKREWSIRYLLRKHGIKRIVRWEPDPAKEPEHVTASS